MPSLLEWTFKMNDQVSGAARSAASGLGAFVDVAHNALATLDYAAQGAMALGGALAAGIQPAVQREKTLGAFEVMLGSATDAVNTYTEAVQFANETPFETQDIVKSYKQLLAAQFQKTDLQTVIRIVGDASSLQEFPAQAMESVNRALGQIKSKGKLSQEELNQVAEAVPLNQSMFLKNLSMLYGMTEEQTRALKDQGKIEADAGVFAILQTLQQQFGGGMEKASKQVAGLWSTIESMPTTYLEKLQDTKGYDALRGALQSVVNVLDPASTRGQQFGTFITELGSGVIERASVMIEYLTQGVGAFSDGLMSALGPMDGAFGPANQDNMKSFRDTMETIGSAVGIVARGVVSLSDALQTTWQWLTKIGQSISENETLAGLLDKIAPYLGMEYGGGAAGESTQDVLRAQARTRQRNASINEGWGASAYDSGKQWGVDYESGVRDQLEIHSPSKVAEELGGYFDQGFGRGIESGGHFAGVAESVSAAPSVGSMPPIQVNFTYTAGSSTSDDRAAMDIEKRVEAGIIQALERFAIQSGRRRVA